MKRLIVSADDFGLSEDVNEAIEQAHREGLLSTASLMIAGPAAADAIRRARRLPDLHVGLHCVLVEGEAILPHRAIRAIAAENVAGKAFFSSNQALAGVRYFFHPGARRALNREMTAQFRAFKASGLRLDHANAHKHMHLHPTVGRLMIKIGAEYGLQAIRSPIEPSAPLSNVESTPDTWGDRALRYWCNVLRWQIRSAGMTTNDWCFGLKWSGAMTAERVSALMEFVPNGVSEIYFHPATKQNIRLASVMPGYQHATELATLLSPGFKSAVTKHKITLSTWSGRDALYQHHVT